RSKQSAIEISEKLKACSLHYGLVINTKKTKFLKCSKNERNNVPLVIAGTNSQIEQISSFNYLGTIINGNNVMEEEIRNRIILGNKAHYVNKSLFVSRLATKNTKVRLYQTMIRPEIKCVDGTWIIRTNDELNKIIKNKNIVNYIRAQRLAWFGHVCRMSEDRIVKKLFQWKPLTTRCQGRPKIRWEDDVIEDLKKMKVKNWISCVQVVEKAKAFNQ
ncbi:hypothetical protein C0J52_08777, partial [Blattella germanica]